MTKFNPDLGGQVGDLNSILEAASQTRKANELLKEDIKECVENIFTMLNGEEGSLELLKKAACLLEAWEEMI